MTPAASLRARLRSSLPFLAASLILGGFGCPPPNPPGQAEPAFQFRSLGEIVGAIQANAARMNQALWSDSVTTTARVRDESGREHVYNLDGNFLFERPHNLRMDLRPGLGEQVMGIGSNAEDYWVWIEPELRTMRWGRHRHVGKACAKKIAIQPEQLISALGMIGIPESTEELLGPARESGRLHDKLKYIRRTPQGEFLAEREYWIDRAAPFLIRVVQFRDSLGRVSMSAFLDDYRPAWSDGPFVPHAISILWPLEGGSFTMSIGRIRGVAAEKIAARSFVRPDRQALPRAIETIIQVDAECDALEGSTAEAPSR